MLSKIILALIIIICSTSFSQTLYEFKLAPTDGRENDIFGKAVDISGNELIIGASSVDYIQRNKGAIYVYKFNESNWDFNEKIICPSNKEGALFGISMAIWPSAMFINACVALLVAGPAMAFIMMYQLKQAGQRNDAD